MWETILWIALAIGGIILGWIIWASFTEDGDEGFGGAIIGFIIVALIKFNFTDKVFVCESANIYDSHIESTYKSEALGSKMILEFYDNDVKCIIPGKSSVVLKKESENGFNEVYSSQNVNAKLTINGPFITEVVLETNNGTLTYKRKYL